MPQIHEGGIKVGWNADGFHVWRFYGYECDGAVEVWYCERCRALDKPWSRVSGGKVKSDLGEANLAYEQTLLAAGREAVRRAGFEPPSELAGWATAVDALLGDQA